MKALMVGIALLTIIVAVNSDIAQGLFNLFVATN
jgi:hypothetical protein